ncbi:MAG TPA: hypothetical protein V6D17_07405 [Candidatus Obscuribacterales bacterium]
MLQEAIRAIITRILNDKILLGLVIVGILGVFVGGMALNDEPTPEAKGPADEKIPAAQMAQQQQVQQQAQASPKAVEPTLATDFVKWWIGSSMDYKAQSAIESHKQAFAWMTEDASATFKANFWQPELAEGIASGTIVAAFQPVDVQAEAVNPDGSVVVGLSGTLVLQAVGSPVATHQVVADLLVKRDEKDEAGSLRIAGVYNRSYLITQAPTY